MLKLLSSNSSEYNIDEIVRRGAKEMLVKALDIEVAEYLATHKDMVDENGRRLVVGNGKGKPRKVTTGAGAIDIQAPRVNDRREGEKFTSWILPPYLRKSPKVESLLPVLYLRGISTGKIADTLTEFFGEGSMGLSPATISKLIKAWETDFTNWKQRPLNKKYIYMWVDGVNVSIRLGDDKKICLLVAIGVTEDGDKELLAVQEGFRESKESWLVVLRDLLNRGFTAPLLSMGDGALGFWSATSELEEFQSTQSQRCWVHKIANVLDKLPKRVQSQVKSLLHEMMKAPDRESAEKTRDKFQSVYIDKYPKAVTCLVKDWEKLTTFFDFPAAHWVSLRTTNPIESAFATVKLRTRVTKGAGSPKTAATMAFKLLLECEKRWRKIRGSGEISNVLNGLEYKDGVVLDRQLQNQEAAAM